MEARARRIGWGLPDAVLAWLVALVGALVVTAPFFEDGELPRSREIPASLVAIVAQTAIVVGYLAWAARAKARGSLATDFGLRLRLADARWFGAGLGLSIVLGLASQPILSAGDIDETSQDVVRLFERAEGVELIVFAAAVLVLAPLGEELLFRGVLLRSLLRRSGPAVAVFGSALAFALVHVALDPGAGYAVPALLALGLVSGDRAVRTASLSQSLLLHSGFNLVAAVQILTDL